MLKRFALNEDIFKSPLISNQLLAFRLLGYVYSDKDNFKFVHFARGLVSSMIIFLLASAQIYGIYLFFDDLDMSILSFGAAVTYINIITRITILYSCNKEYITLLTSIAIGMKRVLATSLPAEMEIYKQYVKYICTLSHALWFPCIVGISYMTGEAMYFLTFNYKNWELGQKANGTTAGRLPALYYLYPMRNLGSNYYLAFISPFASLLVGVSSLVSWHIFNASLMRYISFRLDVVRYKISNMQDYVDFILQKSQQANSSHSLMRRTDHIWRYVFASCVKDYHEIKSFARDYEKVTSPAVFIESSTISVLLCAILYTISKDFTARYGLYNFWCALTIQILWVYYWHGNEIVSKSDEITNAIYSLNWYDFPVSFQKDILIFMTATMKPIILKAGLFYMTNESLAMILKTSYSYFTLLQNFAE